MCPDLGGDAVEGEVAVIGAGIVGLSTAFALRQRGADCTVFESGLPGNGQSGGESRIFRHAHDDPRLVRLAAESRELWAAWERRWRIELISSGGVLALGDAALDRLAAMEEAGVGVAHQVDADFVARRFTTLAPFTGPAVFDEAGGSIRTGAAISALVNAVGSSLVNEEVIAIDAREDAVELLAGGRRQRFSAVVVAAGRNTAALARSVGLRLPVSLEAHVRLTFPRVRGTEAQPCLQDGSGQFGESGVYGAPLPGCHEFALGLSETVDAGVDGAVESPGGLGSLADRAAAYVERALPGLDPEPIDFRHCWVTKLPWSDDGLAVWRTGAATFVAGHNLYKQAPALGRALAEAVLTGELRSDLSPDSELGRA